MNPTLQTHHETDTLMQLMESTSAHSFKDHSHQGPQ